MSNIFHNLFKFTCNTLKILPRYRHYLYSKIILCLEIAVANRLNKIWPMATLSQIQPANSVLCWQAGVSGRDTRTLHGGRRRRRERVKFAVCIMQEDCARRGARKAEEILRAVSRRIVNISFLARLYFLYPRPTLLFLFNCGPNDAPSMKFTKAKVTYLPGIHQ